MRSARMDPEPLAHTLLKVRMLVYCNSGGPQALRLAAVIQPPTHCASTHPIRRSIVEDPRPPYTHGPWLVSRASLLSYCLRALFTPGRAILRLSPYSDCPSIAPPPLARPTPVPLTLVSSDQQHRHCIDSPLSPIWSLITLDPRRYSTYTPTATAKAFVAPPYTRICRLSLLSSRAVAHSLYARARQLELGVNYTLHRGLSQAAPAYAYDTAAMLDDIRRRGYASFQHVARFFT
ncbi:hypothetical protein R3P38DRAFT_3236080 [Favolaschia claudopus]|uniref:Uncharacterized protein n=1 Tax=Favolaschia claudopus TaxID=2862362 RepID=A0AAV9ZCD4_9AGAR